MKLSDTLLGLSLESLSIRGKIRVLVSEQFVGYLTRQDDSYICLLVYRLAA